VQTAQPTQPGSYPLSKRLSPPWLETRAKSFFLVVSCSLAHCASMISDLLSIIDLSQKAGTVLFSAGAILLRSVDILLLYECERASGQCASSPQLEALESSKQPKKGHGKLRQTKGSVLRLRACAHCAPTYAQQQSNFLSIQRCLSICRYEVSNASRN